MKILSVDDHPLFRLGLKQLISEVDADAEFIEAGLCEEALARIGEDGAPDLILLELLLPGMEIFEGLQALQEYDPSIPIVIISMIDTPQEVLQAIQRGAQGYIPKPAPPTEIIDGLRSVIAGHVYLPSRLVPKSAESSHPSVSLNGKDMSAAQRLSRLTRRRRDVADLLGQGMTNRQIAEALGLSEGTVRLHVHDISRTLNLRSRTQIALLVQQSSMETAMLGEESQNIGHDATTSPIKIARDHVAAPPAQRDGPQMVNLGRRR